MALFTVEPPMARQKPPEPAPAPMPANDTIRVDAELVQMLREIASESGKRYGKKMKIGEIANEILRPIVTRKYKEHLEWRKQSSQG